MENNAQTALQSKKAVTAHLKSEHLLPFGFARQNGSWTRALSTSLHHNTWVRSQQLRRVNLEAVTAYFSSE